MGDIVDHVDAGNALLLEQEHCLALLLAEDRYQYVGTGHFTLARTLHMKYRALQHPLETQGWLSLAIFIVHRNQWRSGVDELLQVMLELVEVRPAGTENSGSGLIIQ